MNIRALYLDDVRLPPRRGDWTICWTVCRTVEQAKAFVLAGPVDYMSLDHDLDVCPVCHPERTEDDERRDRILPPCRHATTAHDFVEWLAETGRWPRFKPHVHSANPVGAHAMRQMIDRHWRAPT